MEKIRNAKLVTMLRTVEVSGRTRRFLHKTAQTFTRVTSRIPKEVQLGVLAVAIGAALIAFTAWRQEQLYTLTSAEAGLVGRSTVNEKHIKISDKVISYDRGEDVVDDKAAVTLAATAVDSSSKVPYMAEFSKQPGGGIMFADSKKERQLRLIPQFRTEVAQYKDGRVIYPQGLNVSHVYTFKKNGVKEDIVFTKYPGKEVRYSWKLDSGQGLQARMLPDGGVGVYSASPILFDDLTISDDKSRELVEKARRNAQKDHMVFVLPPPHILEAGGNKITTDVAFSLKDNILTLTAKNMDSRKYPLSIDPTIVVTTNTQFQQGTGDGMISYPGAGNITRSNISAGATGGYRTNPTTITARYNYASVAHNGYLYVSGGYSTGLLNDVQYAPINADGTIGSWAATTSFTGARQGHGLVAYNNFLYLTGGSNIVSLADNYLNDVQYAPINADGTVGAWTTFSLNLGLGRARHTSVVHNGYIYVLGGTEDDGGGAVTSNIVRYAKIHASGTLSGWTTNTTSFATARDKHTSVVYNGYVYVIGGQNVGLLTSVQYAPFNADGTVGAWAATTAFTTARRNHTSVATNGYLYVMGGSDGTNTLADVQYAPINANGTVGAWTATASLTTARFAHTSITANGFVYVIGGRSTDALGSIEYSQILSPSGSGGGIAGEYKTTTSISIARASHTTVAHNGYLYVLGGHDGTNYLSDIQYTSINADGTVGTWTTTTGFTTARRDHRTVISGSYLYIVGGFNGTRLNDVQYAPINANGTVGTWTATTSFPTARTGHDAVAYNGYMYVAGGFDGTVYLGDVQYAPINANGTVGTWAATTGFPTGLDDGRENHVAIAYNGYLYIMGGQNAVTGTLDYVDYAPINANGTVGAWNTTSAITNGRHNHAVAIHQGYFYVTGGFSSTGQVNSTVYTPINANGSLGIWEATTSFTTARENHSSTAYNGHIYIIGGLGGTSSLSDVQYARLSPGQPAFGAIGAYATTTAFSNARDQHAVLAHEGFLYVIGGYLSIPALASEEYFDSVQYASINANGTVGTWAATTSLPAAVANHTTVVANGYMYVMGGSNLSGSTNAVHYALICTSTNNGSGGCTGTPGTVGTWTATTSFTTARDEHTSVVYNDYLYVAGGRGASLLGDVQYAPLNANGTVGTWAATTSLPAARYRHASVVYNGYIYVVGGDNGSSLLSDVQFAPINANGTIGAWTLTGSSTGFVARSMHTALVYNGYLYSFGGFNGGLGHLDESKFVPIHADGTIGAWTATTLIGKGLKNMSAAAYEGYVYVTGGTDSTDAYYNDVRYNSFLTPGQKARYERVIDTGAAAPTLSSIVIQGKSICNYRLYYAVTDANSIFGALSTPKSVKPGVTYVFPEVLVGRYMRVVLVMDDSYCGGTSYISDITLTYVSPPSQPTLITPAANTSTTTTPQFQMRSTDDPGYARYKIDVCSTSDCATIVRTIDQTASQTGWSGQDAQTGTAYVIDPVITNSTIATHAYQAAALNPGVQYWWRAYAIDPADSNVWSPASAISSFTTQGPPEAPVLLDPPSGTISVINPVFRVRAADPNSDYLRYRIQLCGDSVCSSVLQTFDQTLSQTDWSGQDAQTGTAYQSSSSAVSSTVAQYTYNAVLSSNTSYWWRAYAVDPGGTNTWSPTSIIASFQTGPDEMFIRGNTTIQGNTRIGN